MLTWRLIHSYSMVGIFTDINTDKNLDVFVITGLDHSVSLFIRGNQITTGSRYRYPRYRRSDPLLAVTSIQPDPVTSPRIEPTRVIWTRP